MTLLIVPAEPILIQPAQTIIVFPSEQVVLIEPPRRATWDDLGWVETRKGDALEYDGSYRAPNKRQCRGHITVNGKTIVPYIADPPEEINAHPKAPCFELVRSPWFRVHWYHPAENVDDAILYVEKVLAESFGTLRRR